jgi:hypothetical protein
MNDDFSKTLISIKGVEFECKYVLFICVKIFVLIWEKLQIDERCSRPR